MQKHTAAEDGGALEIGSRWGCLCWQESDRSWPMLMSCGMKMSGHAFCTERRVTEPGEKSHFQVCHLCGGRKRWELCMRIPKVLIHMSATWDHMDENRLPDLSSWTQKRKAPMMRLCEKLWLISFFRNLTQRQPEKNYFIFIIIIIFIKWLLLSIL